MSMKKACLIGVALWFAVCGVANAQPGPSPEQPPAPHADPAPAPAPHAVPAPAPAPHAAPAPKPAKKVQPKKPKSPAQKECEIDRLACRQDCKAAKKACGNAKHCAAEHERCKDDCGKRFLCR